MVKRTIAPIVVLLHCAVFSCLFASAETYTRKANRGGASDHNWSDYEYSFTLDGDDRLTGTNTFSLVYNDKPTRWHNLDYYGEGIIMLTGHETLTITRLPGENNYKYTLTTDVTRWQWDTHLLKWVKSSNDPTNGTRSFTLKNWMLDGRFDIPVLQGTLVADFLCGNSVNGVIPNGEAMSWKQYNYDGNSPRIFFEAKSVGDEQRINFETYMEAEHPELDNWNRYGVFGSCSKGTRVEMKFPMTDSYLHHVNLLQIVGDMTGCVKALDRYRWILLPELYKDDYVYVDPYEPVTEVLPDGRTKTTTLQHDGTEHIEYTWIDDEGYSCRELFDGDIHPTTGIKTVGDTTFVHYDYSLHRDKKVERSYIVNGEYFPTYIEDASNDEPVNTYYICWSEKDKGTAAVSHSHGTNIAQASRDQLYITKTESDAIVSIDTLTLRSHYYGRNYTYYVLKKVDKDGYKTVHYSNVDELSPEAQTFVEFVQHPYIQHKYPSNFTLGNITMTPEGKIHAGKKHAVAQNRQVRQTASTYDEWILKMQSLCNQTNNPIKVMQNTIAMDLSVPDYDIDRVSDKVVGKRAAALIKTLVSNLNKKLKKGETKVDSRGNSYLDIWPNDIKKEFMHENRTEDFEKAWVSRMVKQGDVVKVYVTTVNDRSVEKVTELILKDNCPMDEYSRLWKSVGENTK